jgi:hypothetical protein
MLGCRALQLDVVCDDILDVVDHEILAVVYHETVRDR